MLRRSAHEEGVAVIGNHLLYAYYLRKGHGQIFAIFSRKSDKPTPCGYFSSQLTAFPHGFPQNVEKGGKIGRDIDIKDAKVWHNPLPAGHSTGFLDKAQSLRSLISLLVMQRSDSESALRDFDWAHTSRPQEFVSQTWSL